MTSSVSHIIFGGMLTSAFTEVLPPADDQLISTFFAVHMMVYLPNVSNFKVNTKNHIYF